jgi:hypothetical protein
MKSFAAIGIAVGVLLAVVAGASAGTHINYSGQAVQAASSKGRPSCLVSNERTGLGSRSLQEGIDAATAGDTLVVKGTCFGASTIDRELTLKGVYNPAFGVPTLDGSGFSGSVLVVSRGAFSRFHTQIENLTITHGSSGGLTLTGFEGPQVTLVHSRVTENAGEAGIGLFNSSATLVDTVVADNAGAGITGVFAGATLVDSVVSGNAFGMGGFRMGFTLTRSRVSDNLGIGVGVGVSATVTDSVVSGNGSSGVRVGFQGYLQMNGSTVSGNGDSGIQVVQGGSVSLHQSTVSGNTTSGSGGGINGSATLVDSTVIDNSAALDGGGILGGYVTLTSSTVGGNTAGRYGGGIYVPEYGTATLNDSSVTGNTASIAGGGIFGPGTTVLNGTSTACGNTPDDWPGCSP